MLNLTRLHLGIAHESQFQGLGITLLASTKVNLALLSCRGSCDGARVLLPFVALRRKRALRSVACKAQSDSQRGLLHADRANSSFD